MTLKLSHRIAAVPLFLVLVLLVVGAVSYFFTESVIDELESVSGPGGHMASVTASASRTQRIIVGAAVCGAVVGFVLSVRVGRSLSRSVEQLARAAADMASGNFKTEEVVVTSSDEIGKTIQAFNEMRKTLRAAVQQVILSTEQVITASEQLTQASESSARAAEMSSQAISQVAAGASEQAGATAKVDATMHELRDAIQQIAEGASRSAAEAQQVSALLNQMAGDLDKMVDMASQTAAQAHDSVQRGQAGAEVVERTLEALEEIGTAVGQSAARIKELEQFSGRIGAITQVISGIADQTNLLALNAAIEAARAGEHGRGFSVVAEEVRNLAERSATSAKEIADLIESIQTSTTEVVRAMEAGTERVAAGNRLASEAGQALDQILAALRSLAAAVESIGKASAQVKQDAAKVVRSFEEMAAITEQNTAATEEMAAGAAEVTEAIDRMARISQDNAAAAEEVSASVEELTASSEEVASSAQSMMKTASALKEQMQRFTT